MDLLERARAELDKYEHALVRFAVAAKPDGGLELVIELKDGSSGLHVYHAPIHPRDLESPQFSWNFQRYLYDCLHDYIVELFVRTPQTRESRS